MCFSASASFATSVFLLGVGATTWKAARTPNERPFAAIPLLFAIQQFLEGVLWLTFDHDAPLTRIAMTYAFSFFSLLFWPVFVPLAVVLLEAPGWRRHALGLCALGGAIASTSLFYVMTRHGVTSCASEKHITYGVPELFPVVTMSLYLVATGVSELFSSFVAIRIFGLLVLLSFCVAYVAYTRWFISVWCYFAAALSVIVLTHFKSLPEASTASWAPSQGSTR